MPKYNGWTNYETWLVVVGPLDGDQADLAIENAARTALTTSCSTVEDLGYWMREYALDFLLQEVLDNPSCEGIVADLFEGFLERVNWKEIAKDKLREIELEYLPGR